jgi:hypothetical protein
MALRTDASAQKSDGLIRGVITRDSSRVPLEGVEVLLAGLPSARTSALGMFSFAPIAAGTYALRLRRPGLRPVEQTVRISAGDTVDLAIAMWLVPTELPTVSILGSKYLRDRAGFDERRRVGLGFQATAAEILMYSALDVSDVFYHAPGVSGTWLNGRRVLDLYPITRGGTCRGQMNVFLNGDLLSPPPTMSGIDYLALLVRPEQLYGVELYRAEGYTPSQFRVSGICATVVAWTK